MLTLTTRPKQWDELLGQDFNAKILEKQIETDTTYGAYLFVGGSGTGKTSAARIFSRELNGSDEGYLEIDAASHSGVDNIRQLNEMAKNSPLNTKYRVICIDEVHALSSQAWQALLKTLEETSATTRFILCTTEVHKVPDTILSRACRLHFRPIPPHYIEIKLSQILDDRGQHMHHSAIEMLALSAKGNMREAIKNLDIILTLHGRDNESMIHSEDIYQLVGREVHEVILNLYLAIYHNMYFRLEDAMGTIQQGSTDMGVILDQLLHLAILVWRLSKEEGTHIDYGEAIYINMLEEYDIKQHHVDADKARNIVREITNLMLEIKGITNPTHYVMARIMEIQEEICETS